MKFDGPKIKKLDGLLVQDFWDESTWSKRFEVEDPNSWQSSHWIQMGQNWTFILWDRQLSHFWTVLFNLWSTILSRMDINCDQWPSTLVQNTVNFRFGASSLMQITVWFDSRPSIFRGIIFPIEFDNRSLLRPSTSDLTLFNYNFRTHSELKLLLKQVQCLVFKWLMKYRDQTPEIIQHMIRHVTESDTDLEKIVIGIEIVIEENVAIVIDQRRLRDPKG